ncbi:MAG: ABC transporter ATP-binding protein [Deltaproteobacteria bacterium]|nr:ABC transporter ATP-binding protein [Deltaproteobacteria bacterium]MBW1929333.1 ABC transporter ATP-binding protein [Deltaproteobacteria bacterium]MBW2025147.1 ABC transporter ATP-binding protein [Deltaproteobacteria bacterium]MBW2125995.1 ABC transporter ATP-binding protein [Deltaproteobacteria bacterium]RLB14078.1 MAG: ABC transporter ATP-binding protein [Deltaproteobacteria bacterium]
MAGVPFLRVEHLSKQFGGVLAVHDVSFELQKGEFLGIIGPNGSGKTTLVNLITGFVRPTRGRVIFQGKDITGKMPYTIAEKGIARTFQMVRLFYNLPAYKNVIIPLCSRRVRRLRGGKYGEKDDAAIDLLDDMGFERDSFVPYKNAGSLPHGYLKRLDLARALALRPELLILDELFSGMSMSEVASTLPLIEKFNEEGITIIMIEHRLKELFRVVDRVMVLNFGEKIADGAPSEVMESKAVKSAYLGVDVEVEKA